MNDETKKIIKQSTFVIQEGRFIYSKVLEVPRMNNYFMITKDKDEITVVTKEENFKDLRLIEKNKDFYKLIALNVSIPFYTVGFLATVSQAIAHENINILVISTYSKDYIMVKDDKIGNVRLTLLKLGFKEI